MSPLTTQRPDRQQAMAQYGQRAEGYDMELAVFEPLRLDAMARLGLQPGQTVLDLGCGTGLSLAPLASAVGPRGRVIGVEQCPAMLAVARGRLAHSPGAAVDLLLAPVEEAAFDEDLLADAALFHFTHDILQRPEAIARTLRHLKPGARVVACGLQWAPPWSWVSNLWVFSAALYSTSTLAHLDQPWRLLASALPDWQVRSQWAGAVYLGWGRVPVQTH
jgi:demethylmenaquinone methyltransferase/2-methoxy-6-polyprenyl-1,4-benzoquinol methylase